jgi:gliding motility-associated lipoprotein GldH
MPKIIISLIGFGFFFFSCGESFYFQESRLIEAGEWHYNDTLSYAFEIEDTTQSYDLLLDITHGTNYQYQNIYFSIHTVFPDGKVTRQTVPVEVCDKTGKWYGRCKGQKCLVQVVLQEHAHFPQIGSYTLQLEQFMRENPVKQFNEVGLKIREHITTP